MTISAENSAGASGAMRLLLPLCIATGVYLFFFFTGNDLLQDSDAFWQIKVGQWIIDHHAVPYRDIYSFTRPGAPWISTSWLSQVLYAASYAPFGWAGPVVLCSLAIAATFAIFVVLLDGYFENAHLVLLSMLVALLSTHHFLARPHVLALPVMLMWMGGLFAAANRHPAPSLLWLPLMSLWANLHGGFVLGLALIAPVALEAVWNVSRPRRIELVLRWSIFAAGAVAASCCTPYGWFTLLAASRILDLGEVLSILSEWRPADFSSFGAFEACVLGLIGVAFYGRLVLSLPRIILLVGLLHMALSHVRSIEAFAFLTPLVLAKPIAEQRGLIMSPQAEPLWLRPLMARALVIALVFAAWASTWLYTSHHDFVFVRSQVPAAAVAVLKQRQAGRVFNAYEFGGYLIAAGVPPFIDGRAELYGEEFATQYFRAVGARSLELLMRLLKENRIDATLLIPDSPVAELLDHMDGWERVYADDIAVVHVRKPGVAGDSTRSLLRN
jgi:hypothetical protein